MGVDFTAVGLALAGGGICKIGAVRVRGGAIVDTYAQLVDPGGEIRPSVVKVNGGVTNDMVRDAPVFAEVWKDFAAFLGDDTLVWFERDPSLRRKLCQLLCEAGAALPDNPLFDARDFFDTTFPFHASWPNPANTRPSTLRSAEMTVLGRAPTRTDRGDALADAVATAKVTVAMCAKWDAEDLVAADAKSVEERRKEADICSAFEPSLSGGWPEAVREDLRRGEGYKHPVRNSWGDWRRKPENGTSTPHSRELRDPCEVGRVPAPCPTRDDELCTGAMLRMEREIAIISVDTAAYLTGCHAARIRLYEETAGPVDSSAMQYLYRLRAALAEERRHGEMEGRELPGAEGPYGDDTLFEAYYYRDQDDYDARCDDGRPYDLANYRQRAMAAVVLGDGGDVMCDYHLVRHPYRSWPSMEHGASGRIVRRPRPVAIAPDRGEVDPHGWGGPMPVLEGGNAF
ncbi:MAG: 3'-5' exonuclease [Bifidobacterium sp.]|nr:3'-5' exonuclease [Bifidobacterium sp.]